MDRRTFVTAMAMLPFVGLAAKHSRLSTIFGGDSNYSASMWTYLWDIVDEGYEEVFRNLSDNGLTSISLATAYHAGKFLAPHNPKRKVVFLEDGTVYFKPHQNMYGKLHPRENSLVSAGHGIERVKRTADKWGMQTRAWIVCCHNTPLGMSHPDVACEDAFGDRIVHNLCPSNADVRKYLRTLVADVASVGIDTIELEALQFQGYTHGFHHEREGIELTQTAKTLLGLCFCPACRSLAKSSGVEIEAMRKYVRETLDAYFRDPAKGIASLTGLEKIPSDLIEPFFKWRETVVSSLLRELVNAAGGTNLRQLVNMDPVARKLVGVDVSATAAIAGGVLALGYVRDGVALLEPLKALQTAVGSAEIRVGLQLGLPESGGKREFEDKMSAAKASGIKSFNFYNYGLVPIENLKWIKEAVTS